MAASAGNPVLKSLDKAKTQLYHFRAITIAGLGFFTDAYDLFVIGLLTKLLGRLYYYDSTVNPPAPGKLPPNVYAAVVGTALCGTLAGQLFFGWAGDRFGRKRVYGHTLILMVIASLGQGLSIGTSRHSVISTLCFFRFWLGFGVGGDYPLSATIMSEYSNVKTRGSFVAAVFAMQGIGYLTGAAVTLIISAIFEHKYPRNAFADSHPPSNSSTPHGADWVWRLVLMFGAVPALMTYYSRSRMPETARYTALIERNQQQAAADMAKVLQTHFDADEAMGGRAKAQKKATEFGLFSRQFARRHGIQLIGTSVTWFLLDVSYYSQNLLQSQIFSAVKWVPAAKTMSALQETYRIARAQAIIALCGTVPGYWFTVVFVDRVGRKPIQLMGFFMMSVFMFALAFDFYDLRGRKHVIFIALYALTFFFANFGPNATTFIIPAEVFPARLRSTCHGISAASGKLGSIVGTFGFLYLSPDKRILTSFGGGYKPSLGFKWSFFILAMCSLVGFFVTIVCIPETKGRSLEDLSGEDADENAIANASNGVKGDNGATVGNIDKEVSR